VPAGMYIVLASITRALHERQGAGRHANEA
jgi:hypothetical protein